VSRAPAAGDRDEANARAALYGARSGNVTPLGGPSVDAMLAPPVGLEAALLSWIDRLEGPWR
jgi:hypothetical protein